MSHIDVTARSSSLPPQGAIVPPEPLADETPPDRSFMRGLAFGLALGLTFWTALAIEIFAR